MLDRIFEFLFLCEDRAGFVLMSTEAVLMYDNLLQYQVSYLGKLQAWYAKDPQFKSHYKHFFLSGVFCAAMHSYTSQTFFFCLV